MPQGELAEAADPTAGRRRHLDRHEHLVGAEHRLPRAIVEIGDEDLAPAAVHHAVPGAEVAQQQGAFIETPQRAHVAHLGREVFIAIQIHFFIEVGTNQQHPLETRQTKTGDRAKFLVLLVDGAVEVLHQRKGVTNDGPAKGAGDMV